MPRLRYKHPGVQVGARGNALERNFFKTLCQVFWSNPNAFSYWSREPDKSPLDSMEICFVSTLLTHGPQAAIVMPLMRERF
jgi:hypothetical protein